METTEKSINFLMEKYMKEITKYTGVFEILERDLQDSIHFSGYPSIIVLLSTLEEIDNNDYSKTLHHYVVNMINNINKMKSLDASLCYGIVGIAFSLRLASNQHESYKVLSNEIDNLLIRLTDKSVSNTIEEYHFKGLEEKHYDAIQGVTSNLLYLMYADDLENDNTLKLINKIIDFLLILFADVDGENVMFNFMIKNKSSNLRKEYSGGDHVNLSLSHGMAAPLLALSLSYEKGIRKSELSKVINRILSFYKNNYFIDKNGIINWEGRIKAEDINKGGKFRNYTNRASWCYGAPGICRIIYNSSIIVGNKEMTQYSLDILKDISKLPLEYLQIDTPTICHGFSGVLMIYDSMYKDTNIKEFKLFTTLLTNELLKYQNDDYKFIFYNYDFKDNKIELGKKNQNDISLLTGSTGVILSLLNTLENDDLFWKKIFYI